ncbi:MAG: rod shape-determining protein RodA [Proteobacteria bacterium]|jgi:rod shape determining protein RodA|nr:rod shape-determining protein RodA [Paracoccaceae bacterium]MDA0318091.1 rod shape-determining protein RodA [Pseudomonadota bacterium]MDA0849659.1 rod shape-determining protein RodA [Pseudomonadota bacterium]MDA1293565.1 rod shape-determining protein RodA [Pseudomonadota bacterium]NDH26216.1 rod shape-determining protein RodA [Paracoccaceae bacterium]
MSYLEYRVTTVPSGFSKILHMNWAIVFLVTAIAVVSCVMLYSVGGSFSKWADPQLKRFGVTFLMMFVMAMIPIWFWRNMSFLAYGIALLLIILVSLMGSMGMGAQRWIDLGFMKLQPSELAKLGIVMALAAYYDMLPAQKVSRPVWVALPLLLIALPVGLVLKQPDLGTAILIMLSGGTVMFLAGVHWAYFATVLATGTGTVLAVFKSRDTAWQLLKDYQYKRIDTFLDPSSDPLGAGYHITQSKIALGSGGVSGRGLTQGTQSQLNFLPEKHTDFIFTTLAEELGFVGGISLLVIYVLILVFCLISAIEAKDKYSSLLISGIAMTFFLFFAVNMSMVMGLMPVVGVPLPLVSWGGSSMLVLMAGFGLIQSAHVHRPRAKK